MYFWKINYKTGLFNIRVISGSPSSETMGQVKFKSSNVLEELPRMVHLLNSPLLKSRHRSLLFGIRERSQISYQGIFLNCAKLMNSYTIAA